MVSSFVLHVCLHVGRPHTRRCAGQYRSSDGALKRCPYIHTESNSHAIFESVACHAVNPPDCLPHQCFPVCNYARCIWGCTSYIMSCCASGGWTPWFCDYHPTIGQGGEARCCTLASCTKVCQARRRAPSSIVIPGIEPTIDSVYLINLAQIAPRFLEADYLNQQIVIPISYAAPL